MKKIVIKASKIPVVLSGHPWIFSGAIESMDPIEPGELVHLVTIDDQFLAVGYAHPDMSLAARILSYKNEPIEKILKERFKQAYHLRKDSGLLASTNAYRLINAEGDRLGGLIVDVYGNSCVIQISTCGMEKLKNLIVEILDSEFGFENIIENSESSSRTLEGLSPIKQAIKGSIPKELSLFEKDVKLEVDLDKGQKTGFFLDQRSMRIALRDFSKNKKVLNVFSYTGGFSLHALKAGALSVTSVDVDSHALKLLDKMVAFNNLDSTCHQSLCVDAFDYLANTDLSEFDLIILDPPAFAKKRQDIENASKGYKKLFKQVLSKMKEGAILYAASCSYFVDEKLFEKLLLQAAMETRVVLKFLFTQLDAIDHPRLLAHKEGSYLKGFCLQIFKS